MQQAEPPPDVAYRESHKGAAPMAARRTGPLVGVRVLDFTRAVAGPFCTMLLADLGADVIKVEPPEGDLGRFSEPYPEGDNVRAFGGDFASINRNKRGVMLDLKDPAGLQRALTLVDTADVLVENFRVGVMDRLGLGYDAIRLRNPRLVYAAIRGFGDPRTGASPYAEWPCYDVVAQAMGGLVSMTCTADGQVVKAGASIGDLYSGTMAALGIVSALLHGRATGEGQFLDVAMVDAITALCQAAVFTYSYSGNVTEPPGNSDPHLVPFDIYPAADGYCAIGASTEEHWKLLCWTLKRPDLIDDPRTRSNKNRLAHSAFVRQVIGDWARSRTTAAIVASLGGTVPVGPVNDAKALVNDAHLQAREMLVAVHHPGADRLIALPNSPIRFTETPSGIYRRPPKLGEHNAEIFEEQHGLWAAEGPMKSPANRSQREPQ